MGSLLSPLQTGWFSEEQGRKRGRTGRIPAQLMAGPLSEEAAKGNPASLPDCHGGPPGGGEEEVKRGNSGAMLPIWHQVL